MEIKAHITIKELTQRTDNYNERFYSTIHVLQCFNNFT